MKLEQVALRAKVSTATVSRVLNNASVVKSTTRARVVRLTRTFPTGRLSGKSRCRPVNGAAAGFGCQAGRTEGARVRRRLVRVRRMPG
jgi:hypothetical protein